MDGRRKPDPKPERENELIDGEIIDLTQVIEGGDNDDIIDLENILEQPDGAPEKMDEAALPPVDDISTEETAALPDDTDDDIIDLEDVTTTLEADLADPEPYTDAMATEKAQPETEPDDDEAVIDLLDVAALGTSAEDDTAAAAGEEEVTADMGEELDEDIIDLEDVATTLETDMADPETDTLTADEVQPETEPDEDEPVIDLLDVADIDTPGEDDMAAMAGEQEVTVDMDEELDEDIIDLEDVATTLETDMADPETDTLTADEVQPETEPDEDEPVIDLLDVADIDTPGEDAVEPPEEDDEAGIIDLTDIEAPESDDKEFADLQSRAEAMLTDTESTVESSPDPIDKETPEEAAETAGPDADFKVLDEDEIDALTEPEAIAQPAAAVPPFSPVAMPESPVADPVRPTDQQVEVALERVIEKIYGQKIEKMMIQTIEKTVKREIEKIKTALLEDSDGMAG